MGCLCESHDLVSGQSLLMADPVPLAVRIRLGLVGKIRLVSVAYKEQVSQHADLVSLLSVSQQGAYRNIQIFAHQIQAGSLDCREHMHAGAQVKGLVSSHVHFALAVQMSLYL